MRAFTMLASLCLIQCTSAPGAFMEDAGPTIACTEIEIWSTAFEGASASLGGSTVTIAEGGVTRAIVCPALRGGTAPFELTREGTTWSTVLDWRADARELGVPLSEPVESVAVLLRSSEGECVLGHTNLRLGGWVASGDYPGTDALCGDFAE